MSQEIEALYKQISSWPRVLGYMVLCNDGLVIKSTLDNSDTLMYAAHVPILLERTRKMVQGIIMDEKENSDDTVQFVRFHSALGQQVLVSPSEDYALIVVQALKDRTEAGAGGPGED